MFANVKKPLYVLVARNDNYQKDHCLVQVYVKEHWRDKAVGRFRQLGFEVKTFEVTLPDFNKVEG